MMCDESHHPILPLVRISIGLADKAGHSGFCCVLSAQSTCQSSWMSMLSSKTLTCLSHMPPKQSADGRTRAPLRHYEGETAMVIESAEQRLVAAEYARETCQHSTVGRRACQCGSTHSPLAPWSQSGSQHSYASLHGLALFCACRRG